MITPTELKVTKIIYKNVSVDEYDLVTSGIKSMLFCISLNTSTDTIKLFSNNVLIAFNSFGFNIKIH